MKLFQKASCATKIDIYDFINNGRQLHTHDDVYVLSLTQWARGIVQTTKTVCIIIAYIGK